MSLPSVTSLTVSGIGNSETIQHPIQECIMLQEASSNVAEIRLSGQITDLAELSEILKGCKNLTYLIVEFFTYSPRHIRRIFCSDVAAILQISAEHSLKYLKSRAFCWKSMIQMTRVKMRTTSGTWSTAPHSRIYPRSTSKRRCP